MCHRLFIAQPRVFSYPDPANRLAHHRSWLQSRTFSPVETQPNTQCIIVVDCSAARLSLLTPSHVPDFPVVDVCPCGQPVARGTLIIEILVCGHEKRRDAAFPVWLRPAVTVDARGAYLIRRRTRTVFVGHGSRSMS